MSLECRKKAASSARSPSSDPIKIAGSPHWHHPRFKLVSYQNAAGLWLKYGAKYGKSFLNAGPKRPRQTRGGARPGGGRARSGGGVGAPGRGPAALGTGTPAQGCRGAGEGPRGGRWAGLQGALRGARAGKLFFQIFLPGRRVRRV
nr:hypothetical protein BDOA9_0117760 [Bradyrhizobium sp. DOA9]